MNGLDTSAFVSLGRGITTKHGVPEYVAPASPLIRVASLVKATGFAVQVAFV